MKMAISTERNTRIALLPAKKLRLMVVPAKSARHPGRISARPRRPFFT